MRERYVGQASENQQASLRRSAGRGWGGSLGGSLERVVIALSRTRYLPRSGEQDSAGGFDVARRGRAGVPLVAECAAQVLRIEPCDGGIELDGGRQKRWEDSFRQKGILGPRRGPRGSTTTSRGHSAV